MNQTYKNHKLLLVAKLLFCNNSKANEKRVVVEGIFGLQKCVITAAF